MAYYKSYKEQCIDSWPDEPEGDRCVADIHEEEQYVRFLQKELEDGFKDWQTGLDLFSYVVRSNTKATEITYKAQLEAIALFKQTEEDEDDKR